MNELWSNPKGHEIEVEWDDLQDCCYYRNYPHKKSPKMWDGFITVQQLLEKQYSYVKTLQ